MNQTFTIEGEWTGYTGSQRQVVHREHTRSTQRVADIEKLQAIRYTDGTALVLRVLSGKSGKPIDGYRTLIADCIRHGVRSVAALPKS